MSTLIFSEIYMNKLNEFVAFYTECIAEYTNICICPLYPLWSEESSLPRRMGKTEL